MDIIDSAKRQKPQIIIMVRESSFEGRLFFCSLISLVRYFLTNSPNKHTVFLESDNTHVNLYFAMVIHNKWKKLIGYYNIASANLSQ